MTTTSKSTFRLVTLTALIAGVCFFSGCDSFSWNQEAQQPVMVAQYTASPVQIDGVLDDAAWENAITYPLYLSEDKIAQEQEVQEPGLVRVAWDDNFFYVAINYQDSDIVAQSDQDQEHHYKFGDLAELFLKPADSSWYWEAYATPNGNKTTFFFPGRGYLGLPSTEDYSCGLQTAAQCQGTLNDWQDEDQSWSAEFAMPIADLTALGDTFGPDSQWKILVARYNYTRYLPNKELSMTPSLPATSYHLHEHYADLQLVKP